MNLENIFEFKRYPVTTLLSLAMVLAYAMLSNELGFIPVDTQHQFAFNLFLAPFNALFFLFIHTGIGHLLANLALVIFFGKMVEEKIGSRHTAALFFACGIMSFALFNLAAPQLQGIGGSGGAMALLTGGILLAPEKSLRAIVLVGIVMLIGTILAAGFESNQIESLQVQKEAAETNREHAIETQNPIQQEQAEQKIRAINHTLEENQRHENYEKNLSIGNFVHLLAAVLSVFYLYFFSRKTLKASLLHTTTVIRSAFRTEGI